MKTHATARDMVRKGVPPNRVNIGLKGITKADTNQVIWPLSNLVNGGPLEFCHSEHCCFEYGHSWHET